MNLTTLHTAVINCATQHLRVQRCRIRRGHAATGLWLMFDLPDDSKGFVAADFLDEKLSEGPASGLMGLPTAAMVSDFGAGVAALAGAAGGCCLLLS